MKRPLLSFSGGLDSTWALYLYLKDPQVHVIDTFYLAGVSGPFKAIAELRARKAILSYFRRMFPHVDINDSIGVVEVQVGRQTDNPGLKQAMEWLTHAVRCTRKENTHVATGVVLGDGDALYKTELRQAHNALQLVHNGLTNVELEWPLAQVTKHRIYEAMTAQIPEVLPHLSVCELQLEDLKGCGICISCKDHEAAVSRARWLMDGGEQEMKKRFHGMNVGYRKLHDYQPDLYNKLVNRYYYPKLSLIVGLEGEELGEGDQYYDTIPKIEHSKVFDRDGNMTPVIQVEPVGETELSE